MSEITTALTMASSPNYSIDQILQATQPPAAQPGGFRRMLGALVGGIGNAFAPGIGGIIGGAISGTGGGIGGGLMNDSMQYLQLQRQMNMEQRAYETASNVMKARHDAAMASIRNIQ